MRATASKRLSATTLGCLILVSVAMTVADAAFVHHSLGGRSQRQMNPAPTFHALGIPRGGAVDPTSARSRLSMMTELPFVASITSPFWKTTAFYAICDFVGFIISLVTGWHVHLDLIGTGAFALTALPGISSSLMHVKWTSCAIAVWGTKLASFLFFRAIQTGHDKRLEDTLSTVSGMAGFWFVTLVWQVLCSLPYTMGMSTKATATAVSGNPLVIKAGALLFGSGLLIETTADLQKYFFKQSNPGKFCNVGLWSISQHPNFFGNLVLWSGILLMNGPSLIDPMPPNAGIMQRLWGCKRLFVSFLTPLFLWSLFSAQANGSLSKTIDLANSKYGSDPGYRQYVDEVPLIIPNLFK